MVYDRGRMTTLEADELLHLIKQVCRDEMGDGQRTTLGYISAYDSPTHQVKVMIPTFRTSDADGNPQPVVTDWIPLGSVWVGNGFGMQIAPYYAAATAANPGSGEQVQLVVIDDENGLSVAAQYFYNTTFPPPGGLQPGEALLQHQSGRSIKFTAGGKIVVNGGSTPVAVEGSGVDLTALVAAINSACSSVSGFTPIATVPAAPVKAGSGAQNLLAESAGT